MASKTAAKTVLNAAKVAGKKVLKVAAKHWTHVAKKVAEEGLKEAKTIGKDFVTQGINALSQAAIIRGLPADTVQSVSSVVREGAHKAVDRISSAAENKLDNFKSPIDNRTNNKRHQSTQP